MAYTETEQTAVETSLLGGVTAPATEGPEEQQVAGFVGKGASKIGNILVPQPLRDKISQGVVETFGGKTGSALNKARIKARQKEADELGQSPLPPKEGEGEPSIGVVEEPVEPINPVIKDLTDEGAPPAVIPERLIVDDPYDRYIKVDDDAINAVMQAPIYREHLIGDGLSDFNSGKIPDADGVQERIEQISRQYANKIDDNKRGVITNQVARQLGDLVGASPKTMKKVVEAILNRRKGEGINVEGMGIMESMLAARDLLVGEVRKLDGLAKIAAEGDKADLSAFRYQLELVANLQTQVKGAQTEYARTLQSFNIPARSPDGNPYISADIAAKGQQDFTKLLDDFGGEDSVRTMAMAYNSMEGVSQKTNLARGLTMKRKIGNAIYEIWQHALLTNPISQTKNIVSGIYTTFIAPNFEMGGGYLIGAARRAVGGADDGVKFADLQAQMFGQIMSLQEAFVASKNAFIKGGLPSKVEATNVQGRAAGAARVSAFSGEAFGQAGPIGTTIDVLGNIFTAGRIAFRTLEAGDVFFKVAAKRGELYKQAMLAAHARGKKGDDVVDFIAEYVADPPAHTIKKMEAMAKYVTLQTDLDRAGKAINTIAKMPLLRYFGPFIKTPYNAAKYAFVDRSPLGLMWGNTRAMIDAGGAARDEAIARVALGSTIGLSAMTFAATGTCSGGGPTNQALRKSLIESKDWQPYSCKIGGEWVSYAGAEPLSSIIGLWADVAEIATSSEILDPDFKFKNVFEGTDQQVFHDDFTYDDLVIAVIGATLYNVSNKTFMQGFANFAGLIQDPTRRSKQVSQDFISSLVPRGIAQVKKIGVPFVDGMEPDPILRDVRSVLDRIKAQIPGLSKDLKPGVDAYGRDKIYGVAGADGDRNLAYGPDVMSPLKLSPGGKKDVVSEERIRLGGIRVFNNSEELTVTGLRKPIVLTDDMKYYRNQERGKIAFKLLEAKIKSHDYQELLKLSEKNDEIKRRMKMQLQNIYADALDVADQKLLTHPVFGSSLQNYISTLSKEQLKEDSEGVQ